MNKKIALKSIKKHLFLVSIFLLIIGMPLIILYISNHYNQFFNTPKLENQSLNLSDYRIDSNVIPLSGDWECYPGKWLVTDKIEQRIPNKVVKIPMQWISHQEDLEALETITYGSYRIVLTNVKTEIDLMASLHNISGAWRIFINDQLIASSGHLSKEPNKVVFSQRIERRQFDFAQKPEEELILEIAKKDGMLLHMTPDLISVQKGFAYEKDQVIFSGMFLGIYLLIFSFLLIGVFIPRDRLGQLYFLLMMILIFLTIIMRIDIGGLSELIWKNLDSNLERFFIEVPMIFLPLLYIPGIEIFVGLKRNPKFFKKMLLFSLIIIAAMHLLSLDKIKNMEILFWILSFANYIIVLFYIFRIYMMGKKDAALILIAYTFLFLGYIVNTFYVAGFLVFAMIFFFPVAILIFLISNIFIYLKQNERIQKEALRLVKVEALNKEIEGKLMLAQIQPHFLYNALTSILMMIRKDPQKAETALLKFALFLRMNMKTLGSTEAVSFKEALEHVQNYIAIEELRMGDRLEIIYKIGSTDFKIPSLTVQPLVENAIKYGPGKRVEGGKVTIKTYETPKDYYVEISDNGDGFDVKTLEGESEKSLGIRNVKMRLETMVHGRLEIISSQGEGTCAKIIIPKEK